MLYAGHKKTRKTFVMRVFRTSYQALVTSWRPCVLFRIILIFIVIFVINFTQGSIKGPKKA